MLGEWFAQEESMSRLGLWIACWVMALSLTLPLSKASARTDVSINLRLGDPYRGPQMVFQSEPDVVVVPGTRVYYVRDYDYDIYRYGSYWYYNYDGGWYRSSRYNGHFTYVGPRAVPRSVAYVPVRYRRHWGGGTYRREAARDNWHDNGRGHEDNGHGRWHEDNGRGHGHNH
jgi:hypothetical protein